MPDRLAELVRQRALLEEHLAWLNREIDEATRSSGANVSSLALAPPPTARPPLPPQVSTTLTPSEGARSSVPAQNSPSADDIFAEYRVPPAAMKDSVRKGCLLYFVAGLGLLFVVVAILYFALRST
jgi:hypothetical protein